MKIVLQRVKAAAVKVDGNLISRIGKGFLLLVGIGPEDDENSLKKAAKKIGSLRVFEDSEGKMNLDLRAVEGEVLAVSQFTLYADCNKGNRPSFARAAEPNEANRLFDKFAEILQEGGIKVSVGVFGKRMEVELINWGPVTILLEF